MRYTAPISVLNYLRLASDHGILAKDGRALKMLGTADTFVFDQTGTLTGGVPEVGHIYSHAASQRNSRSSTRATAV